MAVRIPQRARNDLNEPAVPTTPGLPAGSKTDCGTFGTRQDESERAPDLQCHVASIPLVSSGFPANCGPNQLWPQCGPTLFH
jgi:hypothetical protein